MKRLLLVMCAVMLLLTGCSQQPADLSMEEDKEIITLHAITLGTEPEGGLDSLYAQLDQLTIPELGCRLRFTYIPWGDERNQLNIAIASGEYDIIPQGNFSDYQLMASRNAFWDIKPYLKLVPELVKHYHIFGENVLAGSEVDGKLYGVPQYGAPGVGANEGFFYREDLRKQWGLEPITDLASMEAFLYRAKTDPAFADKPLITDNRIWTSLWEILAKDKYFEISGYTETPYAVCAIDDPYHVLSRVETPEFREVLAYIRRWYQDGILDKRLLTLSANEGTSGRVMMVAGEKPCETNSPLWTIHRDWVPALQDAHPDWEFGFYPYSSGGRVMGYKTSAGGGSLLCISSRTKYPELCLCLLEKVHTDQRYYDLLLYGVEGVHYHKVDEAVHHKGVASEKRYMGWTAATDGYRLRDEANLNPTQWQTEVYQPIMAMFEECTEKAIFSPLNHFIFNVSPVSKEATRLEEAWNDYMMPLLCGLSEDIDAELGLAIDKLEDAGLADYLGQIQLQLDVHAQQ